MLVLTRKTDQTIRVGDNVTITILKVRGNTVRIGISAPREVPVIRGELEKQMAMEAPQPVTIEFKTKPEEQGGGLRVVCDDSNQAIPIGITSNRLQQLVAKVSHFE